ncbi:fibronectin type III domain-containing protein [Ensifer sp. ENS08]|nr:fibronectin type III domain-containing protein [Ensifer sp. ENS08]
MTPYGELTFHSVGTCTINADAAGNEAYHPAPTASRSFLVNPALPGAPTIGTATPLDPEGAFVYFTPPADTGGGAVTEYIVTSSPHGKIGVGTQSPIAVHGLWSGMPYTFTVAAKNAAGTGPTSAPSQAVTPRNYQNIFFNPGPQTFGTTPILSATNNSGIPVVFSSTTPDVCTVTPYGELTFHSAGTCTINADAAGNEAYHPAPTASRSFLVNPALPGAPTIGTATAGDKQADVSFIAPASTGGAPVTYTVTANPGGAMGTGASSPVTVAGLTNGVAYTFSVTAANVAGTGSASAASNSITPAATQAITFVNPGAQNFGTTPILTATSDSGLLPTFTSSTTGVCTITSGGALTFVSAGTCAINAHQAGNASYLPAAQVSRSFTVNAVVPSAPLIGSATAGDTRATITFTAPTSDGGTAVTDYTLTVNPGGANFTASSSPITATALTNGTAYTFTVAATNAAGMGAPSAASNAVTPVAAQFITFANPGSQTVGSASTLAATTSSGLTSVFTSSTPSVCTITGSATLTPIAIGTCTISVDQPGNAAYLAAPTVTQTFAINPQLPTAGNVPATVAANSTANPVTLSLSGGTADSVAVAAAPSHGTATASGTSISYTPDPGYSGADSFTYTATNATGTSTPATVTVTVSAPTFAFTPAAGALDGGTVGRAYSQSVSVANGTAPYSYTVAAGALPAGLRFDASSGAITGTPTTEGAYGFTIAVSDANGATGSAAYTVAIGRQIPVADNVSATVAANSTANPVTLSLSGGAVDSVAIAAAPSHGTATASGTSISYAPDPGYSGADSFTYTATNATGTSAPATVNITVAASKLFFSPAGGDLPDAMAGETYLTRVTARGGQGGILYSHARGELPKGMILNVSTGELTGPLPADAEVKSYSLTIAARDAIGNTGEASYRLTVKARGVTVTSRSYTLEKGEAPRNVYLNAGATGGPFTAAGIAFVRPSTAGKAEIIEGELAASGDFVPVGYYLKFRPNPGFVGTAVVGYRLESALGASNTGTISYAIVHNRAKVAAEIDGLVRDFVRTRQNLLSTAIEVPGLIERRKMGRAGNDPISTSMSPAEDGMTLGFSTSLAQLRSTEEAGEGGDGGAAMSPFNIWIDGTVAVHKRDENGGRWGTFGLISAGADYLLAEKALIGLSFHFDRMTDPTDADAELTGNGWLAGPYASFELGSGVFLDTSLLYGGSWNDVETEYFDGSFDTRRMMWDTKLQGQWQLGDATVLTPALRAVFLNEKVEDYSVSNGGGTKVDLQGFTQDQLRLSLGAELERAYRLENGLLLTPRFGFTAGFAALDNSGAFGTVSAGLNLSNAINWDFDFSLLYGIEREGEQTVGAKARAHVRF